MLKSLIFLCTTRANMLVKIKDHEFSFTKDLLSLECDKIERQTMSENKAPFIYYKTC
jgi:hypothetical protein